MPCDQTMFVILLLIPEGNLKHKHRALVAFHPRRFLRAVERTVMHTIQADCRGLPNYPITNTVQATFNPFK